MAKQVEWTYEVKGYGKFPIDMLRYDRAWPAREDDSILISQQMVARVDREVTISIRGLKAPTTDRWRSFGWSVRAIDNGQVS